MANVYDIIIRPIITERSMEATGTKKYVFEVAPTAGKIEIKNAVEQIFGVPGLGTFFVTSIQNRDYTTIMGVTVFYSALLVGLNLVVDLGYALVDPRIKFD